MVCASLYGFVPARFCYPDGCYFKDGAVHGVFSLSSCYDAVSGGHIEYGEYLERENMAQLAVLAFLSGHVRNGVIGNAQWLAVQVPSVLRRKNEIHQPFYTIVNHNARACLPRTKYALSSRVDVGVGYI